MFLEERRGWGERGRGGWGRAGSCGGGGIKGNLGLVMLVLVHITNSTLD